MDLLRPFLCYAVWTFLQGYVTQAENDFEKTDPNDGEEIAGGLEDSTEPSSETRSRPKRRKKVIPDEQILLDTLLDNYHKYARPVGNASEIVTVKFGLTLVQISDMDEVNQVLTLNVWLEQEWYDERLTWDPKDYNNLSKLRIPCEKLWLPDIVLYNSADDFTTGYMNSKAMVQSDGNVFWPPPAKFRSSCTIDITYFPFDDQICELKFGSWTYDGLQVDITNRSATVDLQNYVLSGEWELIKVGLKRTEVTYACCKEPYPDVRFTIVIRRKTLFYLFNIIFPCLWLTILSLLGFWLPPDSGEKITLGITVLLAFSVFMLLIAESMPATSEFVPLIGIYLTVTMGMTSLSIILTVFVLQLHHIGPHQKPVPRWLRTLVFNVLAKVVCLCYASKSFKLKLNSPSTKPQQQMINTTKYTMPGYYSNAIEPVKYLHGSEYNKYQQHHPDGGTITPTCNGLANKNIRQTTKPGSVHALQQHEIAKYPAWGIDPVNKRGSPTPIPPPQSSYQTTANNIINRNTLLQSTHPDRIMCQETSVDTDFQKGTSSYENRNHGRYTARPSIMTASSSNSPGRQWWNNVTIARNSIAVASGYNNEVDPLEQVEAEWQFVAHVMDRLLFWLFLLVAFVSSFAILVIKPLLKPQSYDLEGLYDAKK